MLSPAFVSCERELGKQVHTNPIRNKGLYKHVSSAELKFIGIYSTDSG
jgi:hypothetical protein